MMAEGALTPEREWRTALPNEVAAIEFLLELNGLAGVPELREQLRQLRSSRTLAAPGYIDLDVGTAPAANVAHSVLPIQLHEFGPAEGKRWTMAAWVMLWFEDGKMDCIEHPRWDSTDPGEIPPRRVLFSQNDDSGPAAFAGKVRRAWAWLIGPLGKLPR